MAVVVGSSLKWQGRVLMIHALGCQDCQSGVPLVRMTSPNPINVVLLPKAAQVHCFSLTAIFLCIICSQICGGFTTHPICDNCYPKRARASYPPGAHSGIKTQCSQCCIVWPPPCLHSGFSLLERMLFSHL